MKNLTTSESIIGKLSGAVSANQPTFVMAWLDSDDTPGQNDGAFNSANEVTLVAAPASDQRIFLQGTIHNLDTASVTVTVQVAEGANRYTIYEETLVTGQTIDFGPAIATNAGIPTTWVDTDGTLAANSDAKLATQKATKTYADTKVPKSAFTQDSGFLVGTGAGAYAEETGATARTSMGAAASGANTDITSILNAALKVGRDASNNIDFGTDDTLIVTVGDVELFRGSATTLLLNDLILQRANFLDCGIITNAIGDFGGGSQAISYASGSWVSATVSTSEFTFTFTNSVASDDFGIFGLALTNGGSQTGNWPTIHTAGGVAFPTLTTSGKDLLVFATYDGGTTHILWGYLLDVKAPA